MAYNQVLAQRLRSELKLTPDVQEKKMFGGVGFLIHGNMACGVHGDELIVRVGPQGFAGALSRPHTRPFDMTGKPMSGWVLVAPQGYASENELTGWVRLGVEFAQSLPSK